MNAEAVVEARGLVATYPDGHRRTEVLSGASLVLEAGQVAALVGRSGSGKSTFLHLLGLLTRPASGSVRIQGRAAETLHDRERARLRGQAIGFVFQAANLLPQHSALNNVVLPWQGASGQGIGRARGLLDSFGLAGRLHHRPDQLSGGEQQRVALARALVNRPAVLLADEPTGALDSENERALLDELRTLAAQGTAVLIVTHSQLVASYADVRWTLEGGRTRLDSPEGVAG